MIHWENTIKFLVNSFFFVVLVVKKIKSRVIVIIGFKLDVIYLQ